MTDDRVAVLENGEYRIGHFGMEKVGLMLSRRFSNLFESFDGQIALVFESNHQLLTGNY